jgi:homopolymeric O-antigen transport system permease protein
MEAITSTPRARGAGSRRNYLARVWAARYFWWQLAMSDVRARYRRSFLGILWAVVVPAAMTALLTFVIGKVFRAPIENLAPFIFSGLIVWEFLASTSTMGCGCLINAAPYIKQFRHPLAIYSMRCVVVATVNLLLGLAGLAIYVLLFRTASALLFALTVVLALPFYALVAWPLATITSFLNSRFRDTSQMIGIVLQMLYFASPVFIEPRIFKAVGLASLVDRNPVYHLLSLIRSPVVDGSMPASESYLWVLGLAAILWLVASFMVARQESRMIFYL